MSILPLGKLKMLLKNPMALFVYGILGKWYITIFVAAIVVSFWVFKGLSQAGVLQQAEQVVARALLDTKSVAQYCIPQITHLGDFWDCLQNPPQYTPSEDEKTLEHGAKALLEQSDHNKDPYAE